MPEQNPQSSASITQALQRHPVAAALIAIVAFMVWTFPVGIAQAWPAFVRDKTIPEWMAERRWPGMTAQVYGWLTIVFFLALAVLLVAIIIISRRKGNLPESVRTPKTDSVKNLNAEHESEMERLRTQHKAEISELQTKLRAEATTEREKYESRIAALEANGATDTRVIEQCKKEAWQLQQLAIDHSVRADFRESELETLKTQYAWLHEMADVQAKEISNYVVVEQVRFCYHDLNAPIAYLIFAVDIRNKSVFDISIENPIKGHIQLAGERLLGDKELIHNPKISPSGKESLTIKQRLSTAEVGLVTRCENNELGAFYYFDELTIMVAARAEFPQFQRTSLKLPQHIGSKDTPLSTEIDSLKTQLEKEKAKNAKPDIQGELKQVYANFAVTKGGDTVYNIAVEVELKNIGSKATSIQEFRLIVTADHDEYEGRQISLKGWGFVPFGEHALNRIQLEGVELQRAPLPSGGYEVGIIHTGWLLFETLVSMDALTRKNFDLKKDMKRIILLIVDAFGDSHEIQCDYPFNSTGQVWRLDDEL